MNKYRTFKECPKCGGTGFRNTYVPKGGNKVTKPVPTGETDIDGFPTYHQEQFNGECIVRECFNCGYTFAEKTLDTDEDDRPIWEQCGESLEASKISFINTTAHHIVVSGVVGAEYLVSDDGKRYYKCLRCGVYVDALGEELKK